MGAGPGAPTSVTVVIRLPPDGLVTSRNHDSSEACMCWRRKTEMSDLDEEAVDVGDGGFAVGALGE